MGSALERFAALCVRTCVRARVCARARVRACVRACARTPSPVRSPPRALAPCLRPNVCALTTRTSFPIPTLTFSSPPLQARLACSCPTNPPVPHEETARPLPCSARGGPHALSLAVGPPSLARRRKPRARRAAARRGARRASPDRGCWAPFARPGVSGTLRGLPSVEAGVVMEQRAVCTLTSPCKPPLHSATGPLM
jgi:hypothetical protein